MEHNIFGLLNKCKRTLAGPAALIFHTRRYSLLGHSGTFKNAFAFGAGQLTHKCSTDGPISFNTMLAILPILLGHRQVQTLHLVGSLTLEQANPSTHRREENSKGLFVGAFSLFLLFFLVIGSVFLFCFFSFKIVKI